MGPYLMPAGATRGESDSAANKRRVFMKWMVLRETSVDEEGLRLYIVNKKENQGADSTWAPNNGPSHPMSNSVGFVNKSADHPHVGRWTLKGLKA